MDAILLIGTPASLAVDSGDEQASRPFARLPLPLTVKAADIKVEDTYDNHFVEAALKKYQGKM